MASKVWILGGYRSDFARNMTRKVVDLTLTESTIDAADIEAIHVANPFGETSFVAGSGEAVV